MRQDLDWKTHKSVTWTVFVKDHQHMVISAHSMMPFHHVVKYCSQKICTVAPLVPQQNKMDPFDKWLAQWETMIQSEHRLMSAVCIAHLSHYPEPTT